MNFSTILSFAAAAVAVVSAIIMVTRRNPVTAALSLVVCFMSLSVMYLSLAAQFLAIIQILVYAGAIMVLVVFVIMLLNLQHEERLVDPFKRKRLLLIVASAGIAGAIIMGIVGTAHPVVNNETAMRLGTVQAVGTMLFTKYAFPFEMASFVLLVAVVGAVVLAKKKFD